MDDHDDERPEPRGPVVTEDLVKSVKGVTGCDDAIRARGDIRDAILFAAGIFREFFADLEFPTFSNLRDHNNVHGHS